MEQLNPNQLQGIFKDVRSAYRILALYQQRILDTVKYVGNQYGFSFQSGWSKFSNAASHGNRATIHKKWSWDWLTQYLYEFNMGALEVEKDKFYFKIVHQADTGFYDANYTSKISKLDIDQFADANTSQTRLFLVLSKNDDGCPIHHVLQSHLSAQNNSKIIKGNWLAVPYNLERFTNQESTDIVLKEFSGECTNFFGIKLTENKSF